ncbi:MAG: FAD-binding oxidoreductase [Alphaproteobacteria bacterium]|nr:FAD-binding oxidoreductase [Alphaproteobacteria bacterium]
MNRPPRPHPESHYAATGHRAPPRPPLGGDQRADVCVIGGGFTGVSTALELAKKGFAVRLLEAHRIGWGASGRNGGQVGTGQRKDSFDLDSIVGREMSNRLWDLAEDAKTLIRERIAAYDIECELKPGHLGVAWKKKELHWMEGYAEAIADRHGYPHMRFVPKSEIRQHVDSPVYHGGVLDMGTYHLHPLNYCLGLARGAVAEGAVLHEGSPVTRLEKTASGHRVATADGSVTADHVVVACNGYLGHPDTGDMLGLPGAIAPKIMPINNYIAATRPLSETEWRRLIPNDVCVSDTKFVIDYYRLSADRRLLFGGGESYSPRFPDNIADFVRKPLARAFPQLSGIEIDYAWGGTLAISLNRLPMVGRTPEGVFYAQGFSGNGVAITGVVGRAMADAIAGTAETFDVFATIPQPSFPGGTLLRYPALVAGMLWYALRDRLGS